MCIRLTVCAGFNNVDTDDTVNNRQPSPTVNSGPSSNVVNKLSAQQRTILELATRPNGVSSHEAVILIGGDRCMTRDGYGRPHIVASSAARSVAASVSRTLHAPVHLGLMEQRTCRVRDADGAWHRSERRLLRKADADVSHYMTTRAGWLVGNSKESNDAPNAIPTRVRV
jgi:hypothetical protein